MLNIKKVTACILPVLVPSLVFAASFDCRKARSKVETAICADAELGALDETLAGVYKDSLAAHPLPDYVRAKQREWLKHNQVCDPKALVSCLKKNYATRIRELSGSSKATVYASDLKFSYTDGDTVAEFRTFDSIMTLSIWGAARVHDQASSMAGKTIYTECRFEGVVNGLESGRATAASGEILKYRLADGKMFIEAASDNVCEGFSSLPDDLTLVRKVAAKATPPSESGQVAKTRADPRAVADRIMLAGVSDCIAAATIMSAGLASSPSVRADGPEIANNNEVLRFFGEARRHLIRSLNNPAVPGAIDKMVVQKSEYYSNIVRFQGWDSFLHNYKRCAELMLLTRQ